MSERISIQPFSGTVNVLFSDAVIASTDNAKVLKEPGHAPVLYVPFEDIYFDFLKKTGSISKCPIKGTASYWRVSAVGEAADDFMWAYETPNPEAAEIARHGAFDESKAVIEAIPAANMEHERSIAL
jgi:uncharacterized protein (DUF427 family)